MDRAHRRVRQRRSGDDARKQVPDRLSMDQAAVRSAGAGCGQRQRHVGCHLGSNEMQEEPLRTDTRSCPNEHGAHEEDEVPRKRRRRVN